MMVFINLANFRPFQLKKHQYLSLFRIALAFSPFWVLFLFRSQFTFSIIYQLSVINFGGLQFLWFYLLQLLHLSNPIPFHGQSQGHEQACVMISLTCCHVLLFQSCSDQKLNNMCQHLPNMVRMTHLTEEIVPNSPE